MMHTVCLTLIQLEKLENSFWIFSTGSYCSIVEITAETLYTQEAIVHFVPVPPGNISDSSPILKLLQQIVLSTSCSVTTHH
jgi:hypothetical protein